MVLFIDTSSKDFIAILFEKKNIIDNLKIENIINHSNFIDEKIKDFLLKNKINITDINNFAVSVGPGSYTGIRVGYSFILGICEALGKKIITVNLLESMKFYFDDINKNNICFPLINANNNNIYTTINNENIKININDFKQHLEKKFYNTNIILTSTDYNLKTSFIDLKNCKFEHIKDIGKISIKFIDKKLDNNEFSDNYNNRIDYLDR